MRELDADDKQQPGRRKVQERGDHASKQQQQQQQSRVAEKISKQQPEQTQDPRRERSEKQQQQSKCAEANGRQKPDETRDPDERTDIQAGNLQQQQRTAGKSREDSAARAADTKSQTSATGADR
ncbi:hypothetical protein IWZ01DRAFT_477867 [Phyllosticta capitalensis]